MVSLKLGDKCPGWLEKGQDANLDEEHALPSASNEPIAVSHEKHYSFYLSMVMLALIALIVAWDGTALSLALPAIARELHGTTFQSFWASISFILGIAVSQPIYASVSDVVGRRPPLHLSVILFTIGSIVFAVAKDMNAVIAGRLIQGLGAGGLDVLQTIILCDITTLKERPRYLGIINLANAVGAVTGPILGGVFTEYISWRWLGWINVIIAAVTGMLAFFFLHLRPIETDLESKLIRLDWSGFLIFTVIATTVALPLSWADAIFAWSSWQTLVPLMIGIALLVPFAFVERRATEPMIPYRIFNNITTLAATIMGFVYGFLLNAILLYLPLFFQATHLQAPLAGAVSTLPLCCSYVAFCILSTIIIEWSRRYRLVLWSGWILTTVFLGLLYRVRIDTSRAETLTFQAFLGCGLGTVLTSTIVTMLASVRHVDDSGLAAGILVIARFIGSLLGLSVCSTVFNTVFQKGISSIGALPDPLKPLKDSSRAVGFIPELRSLDVSHEIMTSVLEAYEDCFKTIWLIMACFSAFATMVSVFTRENTLEKEDVGRQGFQPPS